MLSGERESTGLRDTNHWSSWTPANFCSVSSKYNNYAATTFYHNSSDVQSALGSRVLVFVSTCCTRIPVRLVHNHCKHRRIWDRVNNFHDFPLDYIIILAKHLKQYLEVTSHLSLWCEIFSARARSQQNQVQQPSRLSIWSIAERSVCSSTSARTGGLYHAGILLKYVHPYT